jgi:hypothetical protein
MTTLRWGVRFRPKLGAWRIVSKGTKLTHLGDVREFDLDVPYGRGTV